jgi:hypothetical protein
MKGIRLMSRRSRKNKVREDLELSKEISEDKLKDTSRSKYKTKNRRKEIDGAIEESVLLAMELESP